MRHESGLFLSQNTKSTSAKNPKEKIETTVNVAQMTSTNGQPKKLVSYSALTQTAIEQVMGQDGDPEPRFMWLLIYKEGFYGNPCSVVESLLFSTVS